MQKRYYTLKPQTTPLPSATAGKGVSRCGHDGDAGATGGGAAAGGSTDGGTGARQVTAQPENDPFIRAEAEDDDGYDPYSDRPPAPEATFQEDPWR